MSKVSLLNRLFRAAKELPRWEKPFSSVSLDKLMGRAQSINIDDPSLLRTYAPATNARLLYSPHPVGVVNPANFERQLARGFEHFETDDPTYLNKRINELADILREGGSFNDEAPYLDIRPGWEPAEGSAMERPALFVEGHEGRHRMRAMQQLGFPEALVNLDPVSIAPQTQEQAAQELRNLLVDRSPVYSEDMGEGRYWSGGEDFPFLRWYKRGGHVNGQEYGK